MRRAPLPKTMARKAYIEERRAAGAYDRAKPRKKPKLKRETGFTQAKAQLAAEDNLAYALARPINPAELDKMRKKVGQAQARGLLYLCDDVAIWTRLLNSPDERIVLQALIHLSDRRDGKAKQTIETQERGTITVVHVQGERPPWAPPPPAALPAGEQEYLEGADGD